jgi:hypothetical protein
MNPAPPGAGRRASDGATASLAVGLSRGTGTGTAWLPSTSQLGPARLKLADGRRRRIVHRLESTPLRRAALGVSDWRRGIVSASVTCRTAHDDLADAA